jgi:enoyl-CoA hydratase
MILTGRPVHAMEAFAMGLANRVVRNGESRAEAEKLAAAIARFPQICLKSDRSSVYEQFGRDFADAMANEFRHGAATLATGEFREGAQRFASGKGRGGSFENL